jgi:hypothetical protein
VNLGAPGDNFGWPYFEGGNAGNERNDQYQFLPEAQAFYASGQPVTAPLLALNHRADLINAIVVGDRYDGNVYSSQFQGDLFFNDLGRGIVRNVSFNPDGSIASVNVFAEGAEIVVQIVTGPDGYLYFVKLDAGIVGRWIENPAPSAPVSSQAVLDVPSSPAPLASQIVEATVPTVDDTASTAGSFDAVATALAVESLSRATSADGAAQDSYFRAVVAMRAVADAARGYSIPATTLRRRVDEIQAGVSGLKRSFAAAEELGREEWFNQLGRQDSW